MRGIVFSSPLWGEDYDEGEKKAKSPPHPRPLPRGERIGEGKIYTLCMLSNWY